MRLKTLNSNVELVGSSIAKYTIPKKTLKSIIEAYFLPPLCYSLGFFILLMFTVGHVCISG
jgi:hypothetical protein